jgi:hypothetical protein
VVYYPQSGLRLYSTENAVLYDNGKTLNGSAAIAGHIRGANIKASVITKVENIARIGDETVVTAKAVLTTSG